jgi:hypothetical protein
MRLRRMFAVSSLCNFVIVMHLTVSKLIQQHKNATRDYRGGRSRGPSFWNLALPQVEWPGSSTVSFMPKTIAPFTSPVWRLLGPRDDLGLLQEKQFHYPMENQPSISADCNLATILTASSATTWKPVLCKVYRHNYNFLIVNHIIQLRKKCFLHYVFFCSLMRNCKCIC